MLHLGMSLRPIYGHGNLLDRLGGSLASSRFPQAAVFTGPAGVGKQRVALWVAQGLLCERGPGAPCDACRSCRQTAQVSHPDLHWFVPIPRPRAGDAAKQADEAAELLGQVMEERRATGLWQRPDGTTGHGLASVRLLHRKAWTTPFVGARKVFLLGDAERLIVQESSQEAANALLKVLEEPPADTTIILTSSDPHALLPTIRSRLVAVRVGRVSDADVRSFLEREVGEGLSDEALEARVLLAEGCIGTAIAGDEIGEAGRLARAADALLSAVRKRRRAWLPLALRQQPWAARGEFTGLLDALALQLRTELADAAEHGQQFGSRLEALRRIERTRAAAQGNVNPQLALSALSSDLERLL